MREWFRGLLAEWNLRLSLWAEAKGDRLKARAADAYDRSEHYQDKSQYWDDIRSKETLAHRVAERRLRYCRRYGLRCPGNLKTAGR